MLVGRCANQEPRQACLALAEHHRSQILTVKLQQVERLQDGLPHRAVAVQSVEDRHAILTADDGLAVQVNDCAVIFAAALAIAG
jgi:hypothetical protein